MVPTGLTQTYGFEKMYENVGTWYDGNPLGEDKWSFPKMGVPPVIIHFDRIPQLSSILIGFSLIFHDKPESYRGTMGYPHDYGKPQMNIIGALGKRGIKAAPGREWGCFLG